MKPTAAMRTFSLLLSSGLALAQEPSPKHESGLEAPSAFEAEFAASDVFRSGSYLQPLWRSLAFEGHYFGGHATDVGHAGAAWMFRIGELKLSPGLGVMFGSNQFATTPVASFRWDYEKRWFVTQGLTLQGFRRSPGEPRKMATATKLRKASRPRCARRSRTAATPACAGSG